MFKEKCDKLIFKKLPKVDQDTADLVQHVSEFCGGIQNNMLEKERKWQVNFQYMDYQLQIDETTRSTLIDWLIQIHYNFKLLPETLFLTVNIIDRYLSGKQVTGRQI